MWIICYNVPFVVLKVLHTAYHEIPPHHSFGSGITCFGNVGIQPHYITCAHFSVFVIFSLSIISVKYEYIFKLKMACVKPK